MKLLSEILYGVGLLEVKGSTNMAIECLTFDSRNVEKFGLFVAVKGTVVDGHEYISKAIELGASAIVCEEFPAEILDEVCYVKVKDASFSLGLMASNFEGKPSEELKLVGITGTNGKTTTATLLFEVFKDFGEKVGLLSTVENRINNEVIPSTHTTPDPVQLNKLLRRMVDEGVKYCFMEVSSHAIHQNRIAGLGFDIACFTNITHDHLDYHNTFDEYIAAKKLFFDHLSPNAIALVNADDRHGQTMLLNCKAQHLSFGIKNMADYKGKVVENQFEGLMMMIDGKEVWTKLIGSFNASNLMLVYGVARELGQDILSALTAISTLESVNGRFQYYRENNITGIVDYAHTPDALKNVLSTIADIRTGNEVVYTIVGCGGDRDAAKRPMMAKIAAENSDKVILTSDNPRSEDPQAIIDDMKSGITSDQTTKVLSITDRKEAIRTACMLAKANDIILIAGKGHETYQEINGVKQDFNDKEVLQESLKLITG